MGEWARVTTDDAHELNLYLAAGDDAASPGLVILQEIFGVTPALTSLADEFAGHGFRVVVPALYDRIEPGYILDYADTDTARATKNQLRFDEIDADISAAMAFAASDKPVALLGYCWGGGLAYWMAQRHAVGAVVSYYGTGVANYCRSRVPEADCQFHLGVDDPMIDAEAREVIRASCKSADEYFEYEGAGHAFANAARPSYRDAQAQLAEQRTLAFLRDRLA